MTSITIESKPLAGDEYWLRPFSVKESIQRARALFRKGCVTNILLGLELMWGRFHLRHTHWYPYLAKIGIDPSSATRRMQLAVEFMVRDGIFKDKDRLKQGKRIGRYTALPWEIEVAFQRIYQDPNRALTHGLDKFDIWSNKPEPSPVSSTIFGISLNRFLDTVDKVIDEHRHDGWTPRDWTEAKEQLEVWAEQLITRAEEIAEYRNKEKKGKIILDRATLKFRYV